MQTRNPDVAEELESADQQQALPEAGSHAVELTAGVCAELLDPEGWEKILTLYARTMGMAVALVDPQGRLVGACYNPQPIWSLARAARPEWGPGCPFCLEPDVICNAAAEAQRTDSSVLVRDRAGFAHTASPLVLGERHLGTLFAGQVFDRFPEPIPLQRLAKDFGLSQQEVWHLARQEAPVSHARLKVFGELLRELGQAFLRERYSRILERNLAETNQRFRLLVDGVKDYAIFTVDPAGMITSWNAGAERLLGFAGSEIEGRQFSGIFVPADIDAGLPGKDLETASHVGLAMNERWYIRKDGSRFFASSTMEPLGQTAGVGFGVIMHDITDQLKADAALLQKQKLESLGVLAGGIAHDFNNLLTGILGNASLMMDSRSKFDPDRPSLETIVASSERAAGLIRRLLAYAGMGRVIVTRFDLSELVAGMLPLLESTIPKSVRVELALTPHLPRIEADGAQIRQIVMDLAINAAEAIGPEGGTVWISTGLAGIDPGDEFKAGRFVYFKIRDSGCGMDEAMQAKIFDPFFTTRFMGRGLGLAAVSGIVRGHNGTMRVESAPGQGSTFRICLPALGESNS